MLQSMRSRENDGAPRVTDKCELYMMMLVHHRTSGPEARDHAACSSCAASPHGGTPAAPAGGVRGATGGP